MDSATQTSPPSAPQPPQPAGAPLLNYATTERVRIGFPMRFVAFVIDAVVSTVLVAVPTTVFSILHLSWLGRVIGGILALAYYSLEVLKARSLGKMFFQYTITAQDGSPATRDQLVKRYVYKQLPQIIFMIGAVATAVLWIFGVLVGGLGAVVSLVIAAGCLLALQPEHLALHDKLFKTAVFGPPTVQFTIPKASDILPTQSEVAAAQGRPAPAPTAAPAASGPTPPPAA
jgi:uncharacterized RDD family membrane protein YckC